MPVVDVSFALTGNTIPVDHGYALYGAVSRIIPAFHELSTTETEQMGARLRAERGTPRLAGTARPRCDVGGEDMRGE